MSRHAISDPGKAELTAADDEATTAYFARIRHFHTPNTAVYVRDFFSHLEDAATARRKAVVRHLEEAHAELGRSGNDWPQIVMGPDATPRAVWEFWTYSQILHTDEDKRAAWSSLDTMRQGMAKFIAYSYAGDLFHLVTVVEAMLRDPTLDDRGVNMQVLAPRPEFAGRPGVPEFRAAKVRLSERPEGPDYPDDAELSWVLLPHPEPFPPSRLTAARQSRSRAGGGGLGCTDMPFSRPMAAMPSVISGMRWS